MKKHHRNHWVKGIVISVALVFLYFCFEGSGLPINIIKFDASEVESVEILDNWLAFSPTKITEKSDITLLIDSINDSKRNGLRLNFVSLAQPLDIVFHLKNGQEEVVTCFPFGINNEDKIDYQSKMIPLKFASVHFVKCKSTLYLTCVELAVKYNPDETNLDTYNKWIERGYVPF